MILKRLQCSREAILQSASRPLPPPYLQPLHAPHWLGIYLNMRRLACCFWQRGLEAETPLPTTTTATAISCPSIPQLLPSLRPHNARSICPSSATLACSLFTSLCFRELEPQTSSQRPIQTGPLCMCMSLCVCVCLSACVHIPLTTFLSEYFL